METWQQVSGTIEGIRIPKRIDFFVNEGKSKVKIHINHPEENMQDNNASFEAWAILLQIKLKCDITLSFDKPTFVWSLSPLASRKKKGHYHFTRFLYRLWKFEKQMPWFHIDDTCQSIVADFVADLLRLKEKGLLVSNTPSQKSKRSSLERKQEQQIEKAFVYSDVAGAELKHNLLEQDGVKLTRIHDQLPVGLFRGNISKENRIVVTGFIDLWAISEQNALCIFELKVPSNKQAGIISELYFYANYCLDFVVKGGLSEDGANHRGYDELLAAVRDGIPRVKAYFLAPRYHRSIEEHLSAIESCLNTNSPAIEYKFLRYDHDKIKAIADQMGEL